MIINMFSKFNDLIIAHFHNTTKPSYLQINVNTTYQDVITPVHSAFSVNVTPSRGTDRNRPRFYIAEKIDTFFGFIFILV